MLRCTLFSSPSFRLSSSSRLSSAPLFAPLAVVRVCACWGGIGSIAIGDDSETLTTVCGVFDCSVRCGTGELLDWLKPEAKSLLLLGATCLILSFLLGYTVFNWGPCCVLWRCAVASPYSSFVFYYRLCNAKTDTNERRCREADVRRRVRCSAVLTFLRDTRVGRMVPLALREEWRGEDIGREADREKAGRARHRMYFSFVFPLLFSFFFWCETSRVRFPLFFLLSFLTGVGGPTVPALSVLCQGKRYLERPTTAAMALRAACSGRASAADKRRCRTSFKFWR